MLLHLFMNIAYILLFVRCSGSAQYGITYPNYAGRGGGLYPALPSPQYLPMLTTPRPPGTPVLHGPRHALVHHGSLPRGQVQSDQINTAVLFWFLDLFDDIFSM